MFVEQRFTITFDTTAVAIIYAADYHAALHAHLRERYNARCYKGYYIVDVVAVERAAPAMCDNERNTGRVKISCEFRARAIVYDRGECIVNARIEKILEDGKIVLRTDHTAILLNSDSRLQHYRVDQTVPVRVFEARYKIARGCISVAALPFVPASREPREMRAVVGAASDFSAVIAEIAAARAAWAELPAAVRGAWSRVLDPPDAGSKKALVDVADVRGSGWITATDWIPIDSAGIMWRADDTVRADAGDAAVQGVLANQLRTLRTALAVAETYDMDTARHWITVYRGA